MTPNPFYEIDGLRPVVHPSAFVHPQAVVIGDVFIGANVYVGPNASLRGDFGRIVLADGSNVQDSCTMHAFPGEMVFVGEDGHIGHGAILHGCRIEKNAMIGIGAVILDGAIIGESAIVAAKALVAAGFIAPPQTLTIGMPAKTTRPLSAEEIAWKMAGTQAYHRLAGRCRDSLRPCQPRQRAELKRRQIADIHPQEMMVKTKHRGRTGAKSP